MAKTITLKACTDMEEALARLAALTTKPLHEIYLEAGYADAGDGNRQAAWKVLQKTHVQDRIEHFRSLASRKLDVRNDRILAEMAAIAFLDPLDVMKFESGKLTVKDLDDIPEYARRCISEIKEISTKQGDYLSVKFHSKTAMLSKLAEIKDIGDVARKKASRIQLNVSYG